MIIWCIRSICAVWVLCTGSFWRNQFHTCCAQRAAPEEKNKKMYTSRFVCNGQRLGRSMFHASRCVRICKEQRLGRSICLSCKMLRPICKIHRWYCWEIQSDLDLLGRPLPHCWDSWWCWCWCCCWWWCWPLCLLAQASFATNEISGQGRSLTISGLCESFFGHWIHYNLNCSLFAEFGTFDGGGLWVTEQPMAMPKLKIGSLQHLYF